MPGAFTGYKVVDFSEGLAGPFTSVRLAESGADVIKVESPSGDVSRTLGPDINGESAIFHALNRNKRSIVVDAAYPEGHDILRRLVSDADVVIADRLSDWPEEIGYESISAVNPKVVYCSLSAYGDEGPMKDEPGTELTVQAMSDYMNSLGVLGEDPVRVGTDIASLNAAIFASQAIAAALFKRATTGKGEHVSVSLLGSLMHTRGKLWTMLCNPDDWYGLFNDHYTKAPDHGYRTAEGRVFWGLRRGNSEDWDRLLLELDLFEHVSDPRFANYGRMATSIGRYAEEVKPIWENAFIKKGLKRNDVISLVHSVKGDAVPFSDYETLVNHPQVAASGVFKQIENSASGSVTAVAAGWNFSDTPTQEPAPAPGRGEHTRAILNDAGFTDREIDQMQGKGVLG